MEPETMSELREQLDAKHQIQKQIVEEATHVEGGEEKQDLTRVSCLGSAVNKLEGAEKVKRVAEIAAELNDAIAALEIKISTAEVVDGFKASQRKRDDERRRPPFPSDLTSRLTGKPLSFKQIAARIVDDPMFKAWQRGSRDGRIEVDASFMEAKTLMTTTAGWAAEATRTGVLVDIPLRPLQIMDILPRGTTGQNTVVFMSQSTRTQAAAEIAEGAAKPEATFVWAEASTPVQEIAVSQSVTDLMLEDELMIAGLIETQLREDINERLDQQALIGNGTSPNLRGILNVVGILTQAKGADTIPTAIRKAITKVRTGVSRARPTHVLLHPNDWQEIALLTDANGRYIFGDPGAETVPRIWGLPVVENEELTEGTGLVAAMAARNIQLFERRGIVVERGWSGTQFVENKQTIRASMRAALATYRPTAFCTVTGI